MKGVCAYAGSVRHRRFMPVLNSFIYPLNMWWIDLDVVDGSSPLFAWWSPFSFRRSDYFEGGADSLKTAVTQRVCTEIPDICIEKIFLLSQVRCLGYVINPISIYYCFGGDDLLAVVAEVTNTPWSERQIYVLACDRNRKNQRITFAKTLHVSPFNPMTMTYDWRNNLPGDGIHVHLNCRFGDVKHLDATLKLKKSHSNPMPFLMTWKIALWIYLQAAKLFFIRRAPFYSHKKSDGRQRGNYS